MNHWKYTHAKNTTCEQLQGSESLAEPEFDSQCERDAIVTASAPSGLVAEDCHRSSRLRGYRCLIVR